MNGIRMMVLTGVLTVGGWGLMVPPAQAQVPPRPIPAPAPRYFYGFGPSGYGYYYYPAVPTAPVYRGGFYSSPHTRRDRASDSSRGPAHDATEQHVASGRGPDRPRRAAVQALAAATAVAGQGTRNSGTAR